MGERPGLIVGDNEHVVQGSMLAVGQVAPDFLLLRHNMVERSLADYGDDVKIISVIPSVDTNVCSLQTQRFNEDVAEMGEGVVFITVSVDLPFALARYMADEGIENMEALSDHRNMQFAYDYGVHDLDWRICQRAVFVLDRENVIRYLEYVPVISDEVDYEATLTVARDLL